MAAKFNLSDPADLGAFKVGRLAALFAIITLAIGENFFVFIIFEAYLLAEIDLIINQKSERLENVCNT